MAFLILLPITLLLNISLIKTLLMPNIMMKKSKILLRKPDKTNVIDYLYMQIIINGEKTLDLIYLILLVSVSKNCIYFTHMLWIYLMIMMIRMSKFKYGKIC